ncbi:hypothetical protein FQB35_07300 [Crassaminicella thermophila]|uniref:Dihydroorotate dehydrogenase electron transfer subunit iron-sulphur cluster binding domain-containing protein n=1 Tax=Crassaminicella thermophila TaxID=2599308 RepID=A0A5C0SCE1_CRATE|nr:hypothetical protein [Crassaminicella thermophila]QEK12195.1 hypothetical protein FQB35_07300 [Crassaminicella thermophila]
MIQLNLREEKGLNEFRNILVRRKYDLIYSAGSDKFHGIIRKEINSLNKGVKFVITNNSKICCGEGVCGSCTCKTKGGNVIKMCKSQLEVKELLEGRNVND